MKVHTESPQVWKYVLGNQICPYEQFGCMFGHASAIKEVETISEDEEVQN